MIEIIFGLIYLLWSFLKMYIFGFFALLRQILQKHKLPALHLHTGKVAIVTGGASGIGFYVSKGLVAKNVHVVIAGESKEHGKKAIEEIHQDFPNAKVDFLHLDLASFHSIRDFVEDFNNMDISLHILINNAGIMFKPYTETVDGLEYHLQVNYLGHLYLTQLLLAKLKKSGKDNSPSRIINVSSVVHNMGSLTLSTLGKKKVNWWEYSPYAAYADSKLYVVLITCWLDMLLRDNHVTVNALHPGIVDTNLYRYVPDYLKWMVDIVAKYFYKRAEEGADTPLFLALSDDIYSGDCYFDNCTAQKSCQVGNSLPKVKELWVKSCDIIHQQLSEDMKKEYRNIMKECDLNIQ